MEYEETAVAELRAAYANALNASEPAAIMRSYAADGVFMPQQSPSSIGAGAVRRAHKNVFTAIAPSVRFEIAETRRSAAEWAFARTNSVGTVKVHVTGASSPEANRELSVWQKIDGDREIARYCFSENQRR